MKSSASLMAVIFSVLWPIQVSAVELPGTPAGVRAGELIALLNGASALDIDDYMAGDAGARGSRICRLWLDQFSGEDHLSFQGLSILQDG